MAMTDFQKTMMAGGLGGLFGGIFGDSGSPYDEAMDQYKEWGNKAEQTQNPFYKAGTGAIPDYQNWLKGMSDPSGFINHLMEQYHQSPFAKYMTDQSNRAGINAASADGTMGSSPMIKQMQQNAGHIASGDMNQWLQNVLGVNNQYGQGQGNLMNMGANSANQLTNLFGNMGNQMGEAAYGRQAGNQQDLWNTAGGLAKIGMALPL